MRYALRFGETAARELAGLPSEVRARLAARLELLADDPRFPGTQALAGNLKGLRRLRVGDYRVCYEVDDEAAVVVVREVAHRRDVYKRLRRR